MSDENTCIRSIEEEFQDGCVSDENTCIRSIEEEFQDGCVMV